MNDKLSLLSCRTFSKSFFRFISPHFFERNFFKEVYQTQNDEYFDLSGGEIRKLEPFYNQQLMSDVILFISVCIVVSGLSE